MRVLKIERDVRERDAAAITVEVGVWLWKRMRTFSGSGTVWHDVDTGGRAAQCEESRLCDVWWKWKRENT